MAGVAEGSTEDGAAGSTAGTEAGSTGVAGEAEAMALALAPSKEDRGVVRAATAVAGSSQVTVSRAAMGGRDGSMPASRPREATEEEEEEAGAGEEGHHPLAMGLRAPGGHRTAREEAAVTEPPRKIRTGAGAEAAVTASSSLPRVVTEPPRPPTVAGVVTERRVVTEPQEEVGEAMVVAVAAMAPLVPCSRG